jgi:hypothetical protein
MITKAAIKAPKINPCACCAADLRMEIVAPSRGTDTVS